MQRFNYYMSMLAEMIIIAFLYLIILPFKILCSIGSRLTSRG